MIKLFLLKPDFRDEKSGENGQLYFCPPCAAINGYLAYYPQVKKDIELFYVDFKRPRQEIISLIGADNQSCPVLIADLQEKNIKPELFSSSGELYFINNPDLILTFLSHRFKTGAPH
jgi:hypothetical protein